jgi:spore germination protein KB
LNDLTLTHKQLFWLFLSMQVIMNMLLTPAAAIIEAKQDAWISSLLAISISALTMWASIKVCTKYPSIDFHMIIEKILGKWFGRFLSILLLISFTIVLAAILRQYAEFISGSILPKTPVSVIIICILAIAIYPTFHGIGVVGRLAEIFGPILLLGIIVPAILGIGNLNFNHLLPLYYDSGLLKIISGSLGPSGFMTDCVLIVWLYNLGEINIKRKKYLMMSILISGILYLLTVILIISTFGTEVASSQLYPFLMLERYISIFGIIENLDSIVITVWILSIFLKICIYLFVASYGFSRYTHKKSWRIFIFYIASIVYILSLIPRNVIEVSTLFPKEIGMHYLLPLWTGLPLLLVSANYIKGKINNHSIRKL